MASPVGAVWDTPGVGVMPFRCFLNAANEADGYMFHDWIPHGGNTMRGGLK